MVSRKACLFGARHERALADGFELVRQCKHEEARLLVSSLPDGAPATYDEAGDLLLDRANDSGDARILFWASLCGAEPHAELVRRSAEAGYAWALANHGIASKLTRDQSIELLEKAVALGEPSAMDLLARMLRWNASEGTMARVHKLWLEAASLGEPGAQMEVARWCCADNSVEQYQWLRRAAVQWHTPAVCFMTREQIDKWSGKQSGPELFEIGAAMIGNGEWRNVCRLPATIAAVELAILVHESYCCLAKRAVLCWLWLARLEGVTKDIRLLIADLIWDRRAEWNTV